MCPFCLICLNFALKSHENLKNIKKGNFNQCLKCAAPKRRLKHNTGTEVGSKEGGEREKEGEKVKRQERHREKRERKRGKKSFIFLTGKAI